MLRAGAAAERQMAFYLNRAFGAADAVCILNDLRLKDPQQPEADGRTGVCQIDHLILHRWGAFIIESKSVTDEFCVQDDGSGGDEWTRRYRGREQGMPSPIQQARRQGEFLRALLQRHRQELLGRMPAGLRAFGKLLAGSDQRGFRNLPIQLIVAVSDRGKIRRIGGWKEPAEPFQTFVCKADTVEKKLRDELQQHESASGLLAPSNGQYGVWQMSQQEAHAVSVWLRERHQPKPAAPVAKGAATPPPLSPPSDVEPRPLKSTPPTSTRPDSTAAPACKACGSADLSAAWGRYGYYWKCRACGVNTAMPTTCSVCGAEGSRGRAVRIRKEGPRYFRACEQCGMEERIWLDRPSPG